MNLSWLKKLPPLVIIYALAIALCLSILVPRCKPAEAILNDSYTYYYAVNQLNEGKVDFLRTPVYPLFLDLTLAGDLHIEEPAATLLPSMEQGMKLAEAVGYSPCIVYILQNLIFLISLWCFYRVSVYVARSRKVGFWLTLFFMIFSLISCEHCALMTESLSISGFIFLIYSACQVYRFRSVMHAILTCVWTFLLIFLRPSFIFLLPILFVVSIWLFWQKTCRKLAVVCLIGALVNATAVFLYMQEFKKQYGLFAITAVSTINDYLCLHFYDMINPDEIENAGLSASEAHFAQEKECASVTAPLVDNAYRSKLFKHCGELVDEFGIVTLNQEANRLISSHLLKYIENKGIYCIVHARYPLIKRFKGSLSLVGLNVGLVYFLIAISGFLFVRDLVLRRKIAWYALLLWMITTSNLLVIIIGAPDDYMRLLLPSHSINLLLATYLVMRGRESLEIKRGGTVEV